MSQRILIVVLTLLSLGLGIHAYRQSEALAAAKTRLRALEAKADQTPKAVTTPTPAVAPVDRMPPSPPAKIDKPSQSAVTPAPELQRLMNLRDRSILDTQYADLFKHLALPPGQLQKLQHLLLDRRNIFQDVMAAMRTQGIAATPDNAPRIQAMVDQAVAEMELQIQTALGDEAYSRYKQYEATQMQRRTATRVQQRLSYSPEPLTVQQFSQLVEAITQDGQSAGSGAARPSPGGAIPLPLITLAVIERARTFLSPVQLDGLQQIQMEQEASMQLARQPGGN